MPPTPRIDRDRHGVTESVATRAIVINGAHTELGRRVARLGRDEPSVKIIGVDSATGTTRTFRLDRGSRHRRCWTARSTLRRDSTPPRKYCPDSPGAVPTPDLVAAKFG